jgi:hypothetical protein
MFVCLRIAATDSRGGRTELMTGRTVVKIVKKPGKNAGNVVVTAGPAVPVPVTTSVKRQRIINNVITAIDRDIVSYT